MSAITPYIHLRNTQEWTLTTWHDMKSLRGQEVISSLRQGDHRHIDQLYCAFRGDFVHWASRRFSSLTQDDFHDAWQESIIAFYEQVKSGRLTQLTCEIKTYLFIIGHRYLIKRAEKSKRHSSLDSLDSFSPQDEANIDFSWEDPYEEKRALVAKAMQLLGDQCKEVLMLKFADGFSIPEIRERTGYPNVNTVSATLSRCLRKLRELIHPVAPKSSLYE